MATSDRRTTARQRGDPAAGAGAAGPVSASRSSSASRSVIPHRIHIVGRPWSVPGIATPGSATPGTEPGPAPGGSARDDSGPSPPRRDTADVPSRRGQLVEARTAELQLRVDVAAQAEVADRAAVVALVAHPEQHHVDDARD